MKKIWKMLAFAMAMTLLIAACTPAATEPVEDEPAVAEPAEVEEDVDEPEEEPDEEPEAPEEPEEPAEPAGERIPIRIATWDSGDAFDILLAIADDFMAIHDHIEIIAESIPDGLGESLLIQIAANDAPDIFQLGDGDIAMFQARGGIQSLSPFITGPNGLDVSNFNMDTLEGGMVDGEIFALIKDFSTLAVYYNRDMFDAAGLDYPTDDWTWEDFRELAYELTVRDQDGNVVQWGALPPRWGQRDMTPMIRAFGGDVISPDGSTAIGYLDSDGTVAAFQFYNDMMHVDGSVPSPALADAMGVGDLFLSEMVAMQTHGTWPSREYVGAGLNFGTVMLPSGPAGQIGTIFFAGYTMWSGTPNPEEAWLFLRHLATEGQRRMVVHGLTAYNPVAEEIGLFEPGHPLAAFVRMIDVIAPLPEFVNADYYQSIGRQFGSVNEQIGLATDANLDIRELLERAAEIGQEDLEEAMARR